MKPHSKSIITRQQMQVQELFMYNSFESDFLPSRQVVLWKSALLHLSCADHVLCLVHVANSPAIPSPLSLSLSCSPQLELVFRGLCAHFHPPPKQPNTKDKVIQICSSLFISHKLTKRQQRQKMVLAMLTKSMLPHYFLNSSHKSAHHTRGQWKSQRYVFTNPVIPGPQAAYTWIKSIINLLAVRMDMCTALSTLVCPKHLLGPAEISLLPLFGGWFWSFSLQW